MDLPKHSAKIPLDQGCQGNSFHAKFYKKDAGREIKSMGGAFSFIFFVLV